MEKDKTKETDIEQVTLDTADQSPASQPVRNGGDENVSIERLNFQIADLNDKYLRMAAELENTRRRAAIDADNTARARAMSIAGNFLPLMDAIDAALKLAPDDAGINAMARAMESAMAKTGIVKIETVGHQLNPQFHNAVQVVEQPKSDEPCAIKPIPNTIVGELQAGYMFGDVVLRPAMVVVGK